MSKIGFVNFSLYFKYEKSSRGVEGLISQKKNHTVTKTAILYRDTVQKLDTLYFYFYFCNVCFSAISSNTTSYKNLNLQNQSSMTNFTVVYYRLESNYSMLSMVYFHQLSLKCFVIVINYLIIFRWDPPYPLRHFSLIYCNFNCNRAIRRLLSPILVD